jgi:SecD/SecF fusion protein
VSDYFERIEQQLVRRVEAHAPRRRRLRPRLNLLAPAISVAVAVVVVLVFLGLHGTGSSTPGAGGGGVELVYQAEPTPQVPHVTLAALARTVQVMHQRAAALDAAGVSIHVSHDDIFVRIPATKDLTRVEQQIGTTAQLYFYDWEANALLPTGKPVASALPAQNPQAVTLSQGSGAAGEGSMPLYTAVKLAAKQPQSIGSSESKPQYYLFGKGGTPVCAAAAKFYGVIEAASGEHCLVAGPDDTLDDLTSGLPPGVTGVSQGQTLVVKPGTVVLQAVPANFASQPKPASPSTQFFVLRDDAALNGNEITNPTQSTDSGGNPDVDFGFTPKGASAFTRLTAAIAHRGSEVSGAGSSLQQHFAVALDGVLVTVPDIDYTAYPDGVPSSHGGEITAGLTVGSARELAAELRDGALPVGLRLIFFRNQATRG